MNQKVIIKFALVYLVLVSVLTVFFIYDYKANKDDYLTQKTNQHHLQYKAIYDEQKIIANLIFDTDINRPEIINLFKDAYKSDTKDKSDIRKVLLKKLEDKYEKLKNYNLKQLHFHLPNNDSFLRMHRPNKFGDNLSDVRATVKYVNDNEEYVHGFEEGRIFNGFRFVYPLFAKDEEHIGSVEISFSALALVEAIHYTYKLNSTFLIRKDIVDEKVFEEERKNYIPSPNELFYFEKSVYEAFPPVSIPPRAKDMTDRILKGEAFSVYVEDMNFIRTIIPIRNPISQEVVATLCICEKDTYLSNSRSNLIFILTMTYISTAIILFLFFRQKIVNMELKKLNKDLDKRIDLEIKRSRRKDISILNNAKMASIADMLNNIAHQWRQPLSVISTSASGLKIHREVNTLDDDNFKLLTNSITYQTEYLSKTIENFREYLNDNTDVKKRFAIQHRVDKAIHMTEESFKYNHIKIEKDYQEEDIYITANAGELIQVILNILNNAKDALIKNNNIEDRIVKITIKEKSHKVGLITIEDNAGGISENIIDKIFDPYFTTKHESIGTGISLFVCYDIVTINLKGKIYVKNKEDGAKFYLELPLII